MQHQNQQPINGSTMLYSDVNGALKTQPDAHPNYQNNTCHDGIGSKESRTKQICFWISFGLLTLATLFQFFVGCAYAAQSAGVESDWGKILTGFAWAVDHSGNFGSRCHSCYKRWQITWVFLRVVLTGMLALGAFFCARVESYSVAKRSISGLPEKAGGCWVPLLAIQSFCVGIVCYLLPYAMWELADPFVSQENQTAIRLGVMLPLFVSALSCFFTGGVAIAAWMARHQAMRAALDAEVAPLLGGYNGAHPVMYAQQPVYYNTGATTVVTTV